MSEPAPSTRNWQSVRTVLEGLILASLVWTGNGLVTMKVQLAQMQGQLTLVSAQLADVPGLKADVKTLTARMDRTERDVSTLQESKR